LVDPDSDYAEPITVEKVKGRVASRDLLPKAPDTKVPLTHLRIMKKHDATSRHFWEPRVEIVGNGLIGVEAVYMQDIYGSIRESVERLREAHS
jgi:hypothetical protein